MYKKSLCQRVRQTLGITQAQMSMICGCSLFTIRSWEQGLRTPPGLSMRLVEIVKATHENGDFEKYFGKFITKTTK